MSDKTPEQIHKELCAPFAADEIEWRIQSSGMKDGRVWGMCLAYLTARAVMDRLDSVCGLFGWRNEFSELSNGATLCGISIKFDGEWITKWNGAGDTAVEKEKGALSGAEKRAAVEWGIGRYLYSLDVGWADFCSNGKLSAKIENKYHKWNPPSLPGWALPSCSTLAKTKPITDARKEEIERLLKECRTAADLTPLWKNMTEQEQGEFLDKFSIRKGELS